jgi:hypothetical protein
MMSTIDLVYFDAGGGHRAAALALQSAIAQQGRPWTVRLVHLMQVLDPGRRFERITGHGPEHLYNWRLERGWTLGLGSELRLLQGMIRAGHPWLLKALCRHWSAGTPPDLVVSLVPNFNRVLRESVARALPDVPYATVMTDLADMPPRFWIEPGIDQHLVCGTDRAVAQARAAGYGPDRIHRTSGMIIRPDFYRAGPADRRAERLSLGLDPDRPTGLVMFGGYGSPQMIRIARRLDGHPLILLCGHNAALAGSLRVMERAAPHAVLGVWISDLHLGTPGCQAEALLDFLRRSTARRCTWWATSSTAGSCGAAGTGRRRTTTWCRSCCARRARARAWSSCRATTTSSRGATGSTTSAASTWSRTASTSRPTAAGCGSRTATCSTA